MTAHYYELLEDIDNAIVYYEKLLPLLVKFFGDDSVHVFFFFYFFHFFSFY